MNGVNFIFGVGWNYVVILSCGYSKWIKWKPLENIMRVYFWKARGFTEITKVIIVN